MNFPENQLIGSLAEQDVARLFTSWRWGVGQDKIDAGYDLTVEPDRTRFGGARFLVQVKGTARGKGGSIVAPVSKKRLREYLVNPLPVLIVRAHGDGSFYWIHAQAWAEANRYKLEGSGNSGVRLSRKQNLMDRLQVEVFLEEALKPAWRRAGSVSKLASERSHFLNSIDPRLGVRVSADGHQETYEIFAQAEDVPGTFQFRVGQAPGNAERAKEMFEFGLPGSVSVEEFSLQGSPLFEAIGASARHHGQLVINPANRMTGFVHLYAGGSRSPFVPSLSIPAELFRGHRGSAVQSTDTSLVNVDIRTVLEQLGGRADVRIGFRDGIYNTPMKDLQELSGFPAWAEKVLEDEAMVVELSFRGIQAPLPVSGEALASMEAFLRYSRFLGRLHKVARATNSDFAIRPDTSFEQSDYSDVALAYSLLKGERASVDVKSIDVKLHDGVAPNLQGEFLLTTTIVFMVGGNNLCSLPVRIELPGYELEEIPGSGGHQLVKGPSGQAWATHAEGEVSDGEVVRKDRPLVTS